MRSLRWLLLLLLLAAAPAYAADGSITTPDSAKKLDTATVTTSVGSVHRQRIIICDETGTLCSAVGALGLKVDGSNTVQPISAATLPLPTGAATSAGVQDVEAAIQALPEVTLRVRCRNTADTAFADCGGAGGSGLTDAELRASAVPVSLASVPSHAVTNAGTFATQVTSIAAGDNNIGNVDIVSSALPTGASTLAEQQTQTTHLSNTATSLSVLDDWDESDRAKVNIVVGQAGITAGSGTVAANTPRVVLATDVALPAGTNALGTVGQTATTMKRYISVGTTEDESEVKASAGTLVSVSATNAHATNNAFLKCTNLTAANTTPGSSAIFYSIMIPAAGGVVDTDINATFSTALTCYIVLGKTDAAVDEVAANDIHYNLRYR